MNAERLPRPDPRRRGDEPSLDSVCIPLEGVRLKGDFNIRKNAECLILFGYVSGSSRRSLRNRFAARILRPRGRATMLFDLLTQAEEAEGAYQPVSNTHSSGLGRVVDGNLDDTYIVDMDAYERPGP